jgi:hypothetical protein
VVEISDYSFFTTEAMFVDFEHPNILCLGEEDLSCLIHPHSFINLSQNEGLSPSCITLSFDRFGSISWHSICFFPPRLLYSFTFWEDFQLFRPEYHWIDLIVEMHLVHQTWHRISFTFNTVAPNVHEHYIHVSNAKIAYIQLSAHIFKQIKSSYNYLKISSI